MDLRSGREPSACSGLRAIWASLAVAAFLLISVAQASAADSVVLAGTGAGTVTGGSGANPPNEIDCANVGNPGSPGTGTCSATFPPEGPFSPAKVFLTATPAAGSYFAGWTGDAFVGFGFTSTCNSGDTNPCHYFSTEALGLGPTTITATFELLPDPPPVVTGNVSSGDDFSLKTLEGTVNPNEFRVEECYFEYGPTTDYGSTTPCVDPDASELDETSSTPEPVKAETEPLEPDTTYHFRLVASNIGGTAQGEDRTFTTGPAPPDSCPNASIRAQQRIGAFLLPGCMALEMVSPPRKSGYAARFPLVSADGGRVAYFTNAALGDDPSANPLGGALYLAGRGGSGWTSESTVPRLDPPLFSLWSSWDSLSFTPDFSRWLGMAATEPQDQQGIARAYETGPEGFFRPLSEPLVPRSINSSHPLLVIRQTFVQGASTDHSHLYFKPGAGATYLPGDPEVGENDPNVYLIRSDAAGEPAPLQLLQRDRDDKVWGGRCGARLGGIGEVPNGSPPNGERNQGAVSADGSRTYFSARASQPQSGSCDEANKLRILERLETPSGPVIAPLFASECSRPVPECSSAGGDDLYQGASLDQTKVYFTTNRQLADSDLDGSGAECDTEIATPGCDLYLYDSSRPAGNRLVQVSAGEHVGGQHEAGKEARVYNGITAISADGSHVYFVATGVLTEDENPAGDVAQLGEPNLYLWRAGSEETAFLGALAPPLSPSDTGDAIFTNFGDGLWGGQGTWKNNAYPVPITGADSEGNEIGGDGYILVFLSKAELTANDGDGRHLDAYRYDAEAEELECLSCLPGSSASDSDGAPFDLFDRGEERLLGTDLAENHRWVSEDGQEVTFMTPQSLLPGDVNGAEDYYLWRQGALVRLPGRPYLTTVKDPGAFLSHDGSTVAFTTPTPLLPQDGDAAADVYVARAGGGYPFPEPEEVCEPGDDCQQAEVAPPQPGAASNEPTPGNVRPNPCARLARRAQNLSERAKRGRRNARRLARSGKRGRATALHRRASRFARAAKRTSSRAKRCRKARQRQRANTDRRAGK